MWRKLEIYFGAISPQTVIRALEEGSCLWERGGLRSSPGEHPHRAEGTTGQERSGQEGSAWRVGRITGVAEEVSGMEGGTVNRPRAHLLHIKGPFTFWVGEIEISGTRSQMPRMWACNEPRGPGGS